MSASRIRNHRQIRHASISNHVDHQREDGARGEVPTTADSIIQLTSNIYKRAALLPLSFDRFMAAAKDNGVSFRDAVAPTYSNPIIWKKRLR